MARRVATDRLIWLRLWAKMPQPTQRSIPGATVIAAATQAEAALQDADATLDPGAEASRAVEGRPLLPGSALHTALASVRDAHTLHASLGGVLLVRGGGERPVGRRRVWWMPKLDLMVVQTGRELRGVRWIAVQDHVAARGGLRRGMGGVLEITLDRPPGELTPPMAEAVRQRGAAATCPGRPV